MAQARAMESNGKGSEAHAPREGKQVREAETVSQEKERCGAGRRLLGMSLREGLCVLVFDF